MGFAYKKLKPSDIQSAPYVANKQYTIPSSSYLDQDITIYVGENIPITEDNPFDPINDNKTVDGNYRRLIFDSIRHLFYQNYVTESTLEYPYPQNTNRFWHSSSYDNFEQTNMASGAFDSTIRKLPFFTSSFYDYDASSSLYDLSTYYAENNAKIRVISIPQDIYGNGVKPYSFNLSGSSYIIQDDGQGNLFDMTGVRVQFGTDGGEFGGAEYSLTRYFSNDAKIYVGNIFYNQGLATITNEEYLCFADTEPVAKNDYYELGNTQETKILDILSNDFDDCSTINTSSISLITNPNYTFPDNSIVDGKLVVTPNLSSAIPGQYVIDYVVQNNLGLTSNTASVTLNLSSRPLSASIDNLTQSCWEGNASASVTFSLEFGTPPYSYSLDNGNNFTPVTDIFTPIISASVIPTRSLGLVVKDAEGTLTEYLETALLPISGAIFSESVSYCGTVNGIFYVSGSGSGSLGGVSASMTSSFSNSVLLPNTFSGITAGNYDIYFEDSNGCVTSSNVTMNTTQFVTLSYVITNNECYSGSLGSMYLNDLNTVTDEEIPITGGQEPFTWSWSGPDGFTSSSEDIINLTSGSYTLDLYDTNQCTYSFQYDLLSPGIISYTTSIDYSNENSASIFIQNLLGGSPPYSITASTPKSEYLLTSSLQNFYIGLDADQLDSGSASLQIIDNTGCTIVSASVLTEWSSSGEYVSESLQIGTSSVQEFYGRTWIITGSFCEDGTGSVAQRNLNFYTLSGSSHWVTAKIQSGSETPVELATSGSLTASYAWNTNDDLKISIFTGSNDAFSLRREFNGATTESAYYITVNNSSGQNEFYLDGAETASISLYRSTQFIFNLSDPSNMGHHLAFTTQSDGGNNRPVYSDGVRYSGLAGSGNAFLTFDVPTTAPNNLYYFCTSHSLMGGENTMSLFDKATTLVTQSSVTASALYSGSARLDYTSSNLDVSLPFGLDNPVQTLHLTASKINTEENVTETNFIFDRQVPLARIRDIFTGSAFQSAITSTGSLSGISNFIARNNQFTDIEYGNTGSFIGPNTLLFRDTYAFGNVFNTVSGSSLEYTNGSIFSGSVSASILGGTNATYFTQREDKSWLLTADIDSIDFLEAYSYTSASFYNNDPLGVRANLTPYDYEGHTIYAASQAMPEDLFYIMIIRKDEDAEMNLPSGIGGGEIFTRRLQIVNDVNRIYYLFMSPSGSSTSQTSIDNRCVAIGKYFIDNAING